MGTGTEWDRGWSGTENGAGPRTVGVEASGKTHNGNGDGSGDKGGTGTETRAGAGTRGRTQYRNEDGSGDGNEISNGYGSRNGNRDRYRNEERIREGGGEAKKRYKQHKSCKRGVEKGKTWVERKKHKQERVGSVTTYISRECVYSLSQRFPR